MNEPLPKISISKYTLIIIEQNPKQFYNLLAIMIDGVYPSQLVQVSVLRCSHYNNLKSIFNKSHNISHLSPEFLRVSHRRKTNHENWKTFILNQKVQERNKQNTTIFNKLRSISSSKSRYAIKTESSLSRDPLLHHNYLYQCQRRFEKIEKNNKVIASRIINVKGELNHQKQLNQFRINKLTVSRLEKFERFKRLNKLVSKSLKGKFMNTSSRVSTERAETFLTNPQQM